MATTSMDSHSPMDCSVYIHPHLIMHHNGLEQEKEEEDVQQQMIGDATRESMAFYKRRSLDLEPGAEREMTVMTVKAKRKEEEEKERGEEEDDADADDEEEGRPLLYNHHSASASSSSTSSPSPPPSSSSSYDMGADEENVISKPSPPPPPPSFNAYVMATTQSETQSRRSDPAGTNIQDSSNKKWNTNRFDPSNASLMTTAMTNLTEHHDVKGELEPLKKKEKERLQSLDVFRGLTVVAMVLVDYGGGLWSAGLDHSPWDGVTFADFVFPAFLFMVGISLALACKSVDNKRSALTMVVLRFLKLFGLGLVLQGGYLHGLRNLGFGVDLQYLRIMGILQRIGIAYLVVAICEVCRSNKRIPLPNESFFGIIKIYYIQWVTALMIAIIYMGLLYGIYVPDWTFQPPMSSLLDGSKNISMVKCNVRGSLSPGCNAASFIDRSVLGISHLYQHPPYHHVKECNGDFPLPSWCSAPFDPEGLLSTLPAILTCFIGAHYGHVLLHVKGHKRQLWQWTVLGLVFTMMGLVLDSIGIPLNKQLYSLSYTLLTGGVVALAFTAVFVLVDVYKWRSSMIAFKWIGAHALMIFALFACDVLPIALHGIYWKSPENNMIHIILKGLGVI